MNLIEAIEQGDVYQVRFLLADGWDPTIDDNKAIKMACLNWHTDIVELLLQDGRADPTADSNLAIQWSSIFGFADVVALLLKDGRVEPNDYVIRHSTEEIKDMLVKYKYRVDGKEYQKLKNEINL